MLSILKTNFKIGPCLLFTCLPLVYLVLFCLVWGGAGVCQAGDPVQFKGIVKSIRLNIRTEPFQDSKILVVVEKGDQVDILDSQTDMGPWLSVDFQGKKGYVRNRPEFISLVPVTPDRASPESGTGVEIQRPQKQQQALATQIAKEEKKMALFSQKETEILLGLNEIDYALNQARLKSAALSQETKALAGEIQKIQESRDILAAQIEENQVYAGRRFNALYRMRMIGRMEVAGVPSSMFDFFLTQNALKQVIQSDLQLLETQTRDLEQLGHLEMELGRQAAAKTALEAELDLQVQAREQETAKKEEILAEIKRGKKLSRAALESLKTSAQALDNKLSLLDKESLDKESLDSREEISFSRHKGELIFPVKGSIVSTFGSKKRGDYKSFTFQNGIDIKVERGEPVRAVFKGKVMFAQWLMGYGNLMIIDHGDHYYTLYAHVEEVYKKKGETVGTGEVIATAGDTGSIKGLCLHFEVRHHGKPVNPMQWLKKGA